MIDPRIAALAEALDNHVPVGLSEVQIAHDRGRCGYECAAAILAALDAAGWQLWPHGTALVDTLARDQAEIARLRAALGLADSMIRSGERHTPRSEAVIRAALGEEA
jgi:hypothetical protein